ncbi:MAG: aspartate carbamoyltransferase catalytic subunit [Polyangiales bacterium]
MTLPSERFTRPHLLGIDGLNESEILQILDAAEFFAAPRGATEAKMSSLRGRTVVNLFYEASTRTRTSFEVAAKRLSADAINVSVSSSSVSKGETLLDTVRNLDAMRSDVIVIRHESSGAPHLIAADLAERGSTCAVVNAGDGMHEHPTQALLDALTIRRRKAHGSADFSGLVVTIAGDILHSRVARSNVILLTTLGATVRLCAPRTLLPRDADALRPPLAKGTIAVFDQIAKALEGADVVMLLRVQRERLLGGFIASPREYARTFGLSEARLALAKPDAIVMHPGPMNRGVEIDDAVANGKRAVILDQVEAGVAVRMAVLHLLAGS